MKIHDPTRLPMGGGRQFSQPLYITRDLGEVRDICEKNITIPLRPRFHEAFTSLPRTELYLLLPFRQLSNLPILHF